MWFWFCHEAKCFLWRLWSAARLSFLFSLEPQAWFSPLLLPPTWKMIPAHEGLQPLSNINPPLSQRRSLLELWRVLDRSRSQCIPLRFNRYRWTLDSYISLFGWCKGSLEIPCLDTECLDHQHRPAVAVNRFTMMRTTSESEDEDEERLSKSVSWWMAS